MTKKRIIVLAFLQAGLTLLLAGCTGVHFADIPLNQELPRDFVYRTVITNSTDFRLDPGSNIGVVISPDANGLYQIIGKPLLSDKSIPQVAAIKDGDVYDSTVDSGAAIQGNYLAFTAGFSLSKQATIHIIDAVHAYVPPAEIPDDKLFAIAATKSEISRFWLEDLYISTITKTEAEQESANASASTPAYGAKGNVYHQVGGTFHDWVVAARLINIDFYAKNHGKPANGPIPPNVKIVAAPAPADLSRIPQSKQIFFMPRSGQNLSYAVLPPMGLKFAKPAQ